MKSSPVLVLRIYEFVFSIDNNNARYRGFITQTNHAKNIDLCFDCELTTLAHLAFLNQ